MLMDLHVLCHPEYENMFFGMPSVCPCGYMDSYITDLQIVIANVFTWHTTTTKNSMV
jgi:hypothetical protein